MLRGKCALANRILIALLSCRYSPVSSVPIVTAATAAAPSLDCRKILRGSVNTVSRRDTRQRFTTVCKTESPSFDLPVAAHDTTMDFRGYNSRFALRFPRITSETCINEAISLRDFAIDLLFPASLFYPWWQNLWIHIREYERKLILCTRLGGIILSCGKAQRIRSEILFLSYQPAALNGDGYPRWSGSSSGVGRRRRSVVTTTDDDVCGWSEVVIRRQG